MPSIVANGIRQHYEECGKGPPLLLVMGLGADHSLWEQHAAPFSRHFRCLLPDNRGAGRSDAPAGPWSTALMAADLLALLSALGVGQAHVVGISMGGCIAQEMALQAPGRVRSLTLVCSWPRCDAYTARIFQMFADAVQALPARAFVRLLQLWIFTPAYHARQAADLIRREDAALACPHPMSVSAFLAQCEACIRHDTADRLHRIAAPTLITSGDSDIFTPLHHARALQERLPAARLQVFEGAGHAHHWEDLERFNASVLEFLLSQP